VRRNPVVPFDARRLAPFLGSQSVESASLLSGGACNSNYRLRLTSGGDEVVARFYGRGSPAVDQYVLDLVGNLLPVPKILAAGNDWAVMRLLPGFPLEDDPVAVRDVGRALARVGSVRFERPGCITAGGSVEPWPFNELGGFVRVCLAKPEVRGWLGDETSLEVERLLVSEATRLDEMAGDARLVHGDFNPSNILVSGGKVSGVLDWEFAHSGSPYMDIGNLLRHQPNRAEDLAAGLSDEGVALPDDWEYRAALVDLGSHLEFLTSAMPEEFKRGCVQRVRDLLVRAKKKGAA
jgi:hypothetical protein